MTNRERAEAIVQIAQGTAERFDDIRDAIEAALDEAEQRGARSAEAMLDSVRDYLQSVLDKVIEMDRCRNCHGAGEDLRLSANLGGIQECRRCNGTGDGEIARYVEGARDG